MRKRPRIPAGSWPRLMTAPVAAGYVGESSVDTFRSRVSAIYPRPHHVQGRGELWLREDLDEAIDRLFERLDITDAAEVL